MELPDRVISSYLKRGYKLIDKPGAYRFTLAILEKDGQKYFLKIGVKAEKYFADRPLDQMWEREDRFISFINHHLAHSNPKPPFRLVQFFERDRDQELAWTLQEYVTGPHIIEGEGAKALSPEEEKWVPTIVQILHWFDNLSAFEFGPLDRDLREETLGRIDIWSKEPMEKGILKKNEVDQAKKIIEDYAKYSKPHLQHGDFVPWHMHDDGFPNVVLVDLEAAKLRFRYYDLAYIYHRLYTKRGKPNLARLLLREFLNQIDDRKTFFRQFLPSLTNRAVGGLKDYCNEISRRAPESNKNHLELQREFFDRVLSKDLNMLL